jgi:hypothetical protein
LLFCFRANLSVAVQLSEIRKRPFGLCSSDRITDTSVRSAPERRNRLDTVCCVEICHFLSHQHTQ